MERPRLKKPSEAPAPKPTPAHLRSDFAPDYTGLKNLSEQLGRPTSTLFVLPYENTQKCWQELAGASRDARYCGLVPTSDFVDQRNAEPIINLVDGSAGAIDTDNAVIHPVPFPALPTLEVEPPVIEQRYHIELWPEKSTVDDILLPLAARKGVNVSPATGETSATRCNDLVKRARASGRPVRVLYISDFDPGGNSMPVAAARKIEFFLRHNAPHLDVQVRPILLTKEQCEEYDLPRTPLKETERRAGIFEARHGEGGTELDALEALFPGELERIVEEEIDRYFDDELEDQTKAVTDEVIDRLVEIDEEVHERHAAEVDALHAEWVKIEEQMAEWRGRANVVWQAIAQELEAEAPDIDQAFEWPEPKEGDEDPDPLFNSRRNYVAQVDRYKRHQGRPTGRLAQGERAAMREDRKAWEEEQ